jgi:exosome complex RNA-binding protein Csl4
LLKTLDPTMARYVKGLVDGSVDGKDIPMKERALASSYAKQYDPTYGGKGGSLGARESVFINRVMLAGNEAAQDLKNIVALPISSGTGIFGARKAGTTLLGAGKEALTNQMTSQEVQSYNVMATGFHRSLAAIEAAGLAPTGQLSNQMDSVIFKEGDTNLTKIQKLSQTRQIVEAGLETTLANPKLAPEQRAHIQDILKTLREAVPFTHSDILRLQVAQDTDPNASLSSVMKKMGAPAKAGGVAPADTKPKVPTVGAVVQGFKFLGGDPALQSSWEKAK